MKNTRLALLGFLLLTTPLAATAQQSGDFTYSSDGSAITITGYTGPGGAVNIPNSIIGLVVVSIGDRAFQNTFLTSVTIPATVRRIGNGAFGGCTLTSVTIPGSVTNIGTNAFASCGLQNVTIPGSVTGIGVGAFYACTGLTNVTTLNGVASIGAGAFYSCISLTNVTIPGSVTSIGSFAFGECHGLKGVFFDGDNPGLDPSYYVFLDDNATIYYLPGTSGWDGAFVELPVVLWNPLMQSSGVGPAGFGFNITGTADIPIVIEAAASLSSPSWVPLQSLNLTNGAFYFSDTDWTNHPARFYRIRSP